MGKKFPTANCRQVSKVAKKIGFYLLRKTKGSHEIWKRDFDNRFTTIPNHGSRDMKRKTLKSILEDLKITPKDFSDLK